MTKAPDSLAQASLARVAFDALPLPVWLATDGGTSVWTNRAWDELTGLGSGELPPDRWAAAFHPDDARMLANCDESCDIRIRSRDGSWRWYHARGAAAGWDDATRVVTATDIDRCKRVESVQRAEFSLSGFGLVIVDPDGRFVEVSQSFAAMLGYDVAEIVGSRVGELTHPDDAGQTRHEFERLMRGEISELRLVKRYLRKDRAVVWGDVAAAVVRDAAGVVMHSVASVRDITIRMDAEEALRERQVMLQEALDAAAVRPYVWDLATDQVRRVERDVERNETRELLLKAEDFLGRIDDRDRARVREEIDRARRERLPFASEYRHRDPQGRTRWLRDRGSFAYDAAGNAKQFFGAVMDVTEEKTREAKLRIRQREFETLIENAPDIVSRVDAEGRYLYVNRAAERNPAGAAREAFLGKTARELGAEPDTAALIEAAHIRARRTRSEQRVQYAGSGSFANRHYEMRVVPEFDDEGNLESFLRVTRDITALHESERTAREAETRFRQIADALPQIVWTANPDGTVDYYNRRWAEYSGIPVEAGYGSGWAPVVHPDEEQKTVDAWLSAVRDGTPYRIEHRIRRHDGAYRWHLSLGVPLRDSDGTIVKWFGSATDVHDARVARDTIRESERRFREVVESLPLIIWTADPDGHCDYLSPQWVSYTGVPEHEHHGRAWIDHVHPDDRDRIRVDWERSLRYGTPYHAEARVRSAAGEYRWFQTRAVALRGEDGRITKWFGTDADVERLKRVEQALRETESKMRRLADSNIVAIFFTSEDGRVTDANDAFLRLVGYGRDELAAGAIRWTDLTPPEFRARDAEAVREAHERGACIPFEKEYVHKDGRRVPILVGFALLEASSTDYVAFALDLTDQKAAQRREQEARAEAEQANRSKDEFLATLSHELRTPMTSILGWTSMLSMGMVEATAFPIALKSIDESARLQARLIDDLLDISRITTGKMLLDMRPLNVVATVGSAIESFRTVTAARHVDLRVSIQEPEMMILGDEKRLRQIVGNLLSNAVKFTAEGGSIDVTLADAGGAATIVVSDTGRGIAPDFIARVFDRFAQQDGTSTRTYGGLGLGLAIVRQLVELHGGQVRAESAGPGSGSVFTVTLPRLDSGPIVRTDEVRSLEPMPRLDGLRVLVVDDEPQMRVFLHAVLSAAGARVSLAGSVAEALERAGTDVPAIIVSDIAMPDEDGFDLIARLRILQESSGLRTPALAVSALGFDDDRRRILEAGFDDYLSKPVEPAMLLRTVAALTGRD